MKYKIILEKNRYFLISRGEKLKEYAVVYDLNKDRGDWAHTCYYVAYEYDGMECDCSKEEALFFALDYFRKATDDNYISYQRLEEIAKSSINELYKNDVESAIDFFENQCELTDVEREKLCPSEDVIKEIKNKDKEAENLFETWTNENNNDMPWDDCTSATNGDYSPSCPWNAPGMSIRDFI